MTENITISGEYLANLEERARKLEQEIIVRRKAEEDLAESNEKLKLKLDAILTPDVDIGDQDLSNIINTKEIQSLMNDFYKVAGMGIGIIDLKGNVLVGTGWQDICTKFHRVHPETLRNCLESDLILTENVPDGKIFAYKCKNNMWDIVTPLFIGDKHVANIFLGQFFYEDETPDYESFIAQAKRYGFNKDEYLCALQQVPRWSREKVNSLMEFYAKFAEMISKLSYSNLKLAKLTIENQRNESELRKTKVELEQRVMERTTELKTSNARLQTELVERRRAEEALKDALVKARHLAEALDNIPSYVYMKDLDHKYTYANKTTLKMFNCSAEELVGSGDAKFFPPGTVARLKSIDDRVLERGEATVEEIDVSPETAQWRVYHEVKHPMYDDSGKIFGLIGISTDITEHKQLEEEVKKHRDHLEELVKQRTRELDQALEELNKLNEVLSHRAAELEATNSELSAFVYTASHVIRAPLRGINSYSRILLEDCANTLNDEGKLLLNKVSKNAVQMSRYIEDMLEFSNIGRRELKESEINIDEVVKDVIDELGPLAEGRGVRLEIRSLPPARGDRVMVRQAVRNIISNSFKFTRPRDAAVIEVGWALPADISRTQPGIPSNQNIYYIRDNGVGFDMKYKDNLFAVFQRLHGDEEFEGTGMGLALVKRIIEKHGGRVWAEGKVNEGATFYFTLPRRSGI